jgi:hypothetical protein
VWSRHWSMGQPRGETNEFFACHTQILRSRSESRE